MRRFFVALSLGCGCLSLLTVFPDLHRSIDSISLLLPLWGAGCIPGMCLATSWGVRVMLAVAGTVALVLVYAAWPGASPEGAFVVYSKNVRAENADVAALHADIIAAQPDVVMLQEISPRNAVLLRRLKPDFPHQHLCQGAQAIALVSKHPFSAAPECSTRRAFLITSVMVNGQILHLASVHLHWPWPANSAGAELETWAALEARDGPIILAGDFNAFPWSTRMRRIKALTGSEMVGPLQVTLHHEMLPIPLPIDHVLAPRGGRVTIRPLLGSDHKGVLAHVVVPEG